VDLEGRGGGLERICNGDLRGAVHASLSKQKEIRERHKLCIRDSILSKGLQEEALRVGSIVLIPAGTEIAGGMLCSSDCFDVVSVVGWLLDVNDQTHGRLTGIRRY
jgi:hypothetical protein